MKIALAQIDVLAGKPETNFTKILSVYKALSRSADLVAFPEMALPGYFIGDTWEQSSFLRECEELANELAKETTETLLVFGNVGVDWTKQNEDGRVRKYNAAYCAQKGSFLKHPQLQDPFWIKSLSPNYRMFDESRHFYDLRKVAAERAVSFESLLSPLIVQSQKKQTRIALNICEDAWDENYPISPIREHCKHNIDVILNISSSPYTLSKANKRHRIFRECVREVHKPMLYVNCIGVQNLGKSVYSFDGASAVYRPEANEYRAPSFKEAALVYNLQTDNCDVFAIEKKKDTLILSSEVFAKSTMSVTEELFQAITYALPNILEQWKIHNVVIGASGGIDSALAAALYTQALGSKAVALVNMPTKFNSELTKNAAKLLADNLRTPYVEVPIQKFYESTVSQLSELEFSHGVETLQLSDLVLENIQARDRSARVLSAIAAARKGVFTCNANKTEMTVGYCTLYGDAGGFLAVLGDLWKHQVYDLAKYINTEIAGEDLIPQASMKIVPSAELSARQDVNKGLGDPLIYPYHDALFRTWVEDWDRKTPEDMLRAFMENKTEALMGYQAQDVLDFFKNDVHAFVNDLEHWWFAHCGMGAFKRMQMPPVFVLSRRGFGKDFREYVGNASLSRKYYELKSKLLASS